MPVPVELRTVSKAEQEELERLVRRNVDARILRRAQIIRLCWQGYNHTEVAQIVGVTLPTVVRAIRRFNEKGLDGLADLPHPGRPPRVTDKYINELKKAVRTSPQEIGYEFSSWSVARLREHLGRKTKILVSEGHLARLMAKHGIVYRRPRHDLSHMRDPAEYEEKKALLEFLKKGRFPRSPSSS
jgi:transposase